MSVLKNNEPAGRATTTFQVNVAKRVRGDQLLAAESKASPLTCPLCPTNEALGKQET